MKTYIIAKGSVIHVNGVPCTVSHEIVVESGTQLEATEKTMIFEKLQVKAAEKAA